MVIKPSSRLCLAHPAARPHVGPAHPAHPESGAPRWARESPEHKCSCSVAILGSNASSSGIRLPLTLKLDHARGIPYLPQLLNRLYPLYPPLTPYLLTPPTLLTHPIPTLPTPPTPALLTPPMLIPLLTPPTTGLGLPPIVTLLTPPTPLISLMRRGRYSESLALSADYLEQLGKVSGVPPFKKAQAFMSASIQALLCSGLLPGRPIINSRINAISGEASLDHSITILQGPPAI